MDATGLTSQAANIGGSSALAAAAPMAGAAIDAVNSIAGGLFSANQARKNRKFQERMYARQLEDNRENWRMVNEYNLPKNQLARIVDAGLNPLLMYGQGGVSAMAQGSAQGASAPHGDSAKAGFNTQFGQAMQQAALINAQIRNINADTQQKLSNSRNLESDTEGKEIENYVNQNIKDLRIAMAHNQNDLVAAQIREISQNIFNGAQLTTQQVLTYMQAREYEIKRYNLDAWQAGEMISQGWENVANGKIQANAAFRQSTAALQNAASQAMLTKAEVGQIYLAMNQSREMFPLLVEGQYYSNQKTMTDFLINKANIPKAKAEAFSKAMQTNRDYLNPPGQSQLGKVKDDLFNSFVYPYISMPLDFGATDNNR